jgi:hypothetical protein
MVFLIAIIPDDERDDVRLSEGTFSIVAQDSAPTEELLHKLVKIIVPAFNDRMSMH